MKLDSKLKGGLAWAGLALVLAVPAANILLGQPVESTKVISTPEADVASDTANPPLKTPLKALTAPATDPVETASVQKDPVKAYLATGKKLPSYISGGDAASVQAPAKLPTAPNSATPATSSDVATTTEEAPIPLPRSARPKPKETAVASVAAPASTAPATSAPLILNDREVAAARRADPMPLETMDDTADQPVIGSTQLEEWDSGSLADYLARKGLLSPSEETSSAQTSSDGQYEGWLVDNDNRPPRRRRVEDGWLY